MSLPVFDEVERVFFHDLEITKMSSESAECKVSNVIGHFQQLLIYTELLSHGLYNATYVSDFSHTYPLVPLQEHP